jgi:hypothetical protein
MPGNPARLLKLGIVICIGVSLAYYQTHEVLSPLLKPLFPFAYVALGLFLLAILGATTPLPGASVRSINFRDVAKSAGCILVSLLWVGIVVRMVSDTPLGVAILILPFFAMLGVGLFYLARSYFGASR